MDVTARTERVAQQTAAGVTIVKQETTVTAVKVRGADDSDDDFGVDDMGKNLTHLLLANADVPIEDDEDDDMDYDYEKDKDVNPSFEEDDDEVDAKINPEDEKDSFEPVIRANSPTLPQPPSPKYYLPRPDEELEDEEDAELTDDDDDDEDIGEYEVEDAGKGLTHLMLANPDEGMDIDEDEDDDFDPEFRPVKNA